MASIGCDPRIFFLKRGLHATRDCFLSIVQVTESANVPCLHADVNEGAVECVLQFCFSRECWIIITNKGFTLYSVSFVISTLRIVYISLKKERSSSLLAVTVVDGASHTVC